MNGKHQFTGITRDKDHKVTNNVILLYSINIQMLHSTFEDLFECRTFVYALNRTIDEDEMFNRKIRTE